MKNFLYLIIFLQSTSVIAFDQITLLRDFKIDRLSNADTYMSKFKVEKGADRCELILIGDGVSAYDNVSRSTLFDRIYVDQNECYFDFIKTCKIGISAFSIDNNYNLSLTCWSKGLFVKELNREKVNQIVSEMLRIE